MNNEIEAQLYTKLSKIEHEIEALKMLILKIPETPREVVSLRGLLKGAKITEDDIKEAKQSLFKYGI